MDEITNYKPLNNNHNNGKPYLWGGIVFLIVLWLMIDVITKFLLILACFVGVGLLAVLVYHFVIKPNTLHGVREHQAQSFEKVLDDQNKFLVYQKNLIEIQKQQEELNAMKNENKMYGNFQNPHNSNYGEYQG
jgi:hypothetical protein